MAGLFVLLFIALGIGVFLYLDTPRTAAAEKPNIVLIMSDDQDYDSLPAMRKLLAYPEGSWVNFTNAYIHDSICTPSRGNLLTGQYSHTNGIISNDHWANLDEDNTLAVWLDDAGYRTAVIGKYLHGYPATTGDGANLEPGWDYFLNIAAPVDYHTNLAVDFITEEDSPFFLWLAYRAPHAPADPPARYENADVFVPPDRLNFNEADMSDKPSYYRNRPLLGSTEIAAMRVERLNSQRELLAIDDGIQTIVDTLQANGQLDNTMIIFMTDNGYSWGSHRRIMKLCPHEECVKTPMFVRFPGQVGNRDEDRFVSMVDMAATIADYAGVTPYIPQDGRSFLPLLENQPVNWRNSVLVEQRIWTLYYEIRSPGWYYAEFSNGEKEMYDMNADPYQLQNIANVPAYQAQQALLAQQLHDILDGVPPPPATPSPTPAGDSTPTPAPTYTATPSPTTGSGQCPAPVPGNAVLNPGFESGTTGWIFFTNGGGTFAATALDPFQCQQSAQVAITAKGANVQLYQHSVPLQPNTAYRLTLAARSSSGRDVQPVLAKHTSPYTNYGLSGVTLDLTPQWQVFTIDFTTKGFASPVSDGRLRFSMSSSNAPGEVYYFDDVVLAPLMP